MKKLLLLTFAIILSITVFAQDCSDLFISEYVEGTGNNKAIELYNPTNDPIDLSDYQLVRYSNGGTAPNAVGLEGIIDAKSTFVVVLDKRDPTGTGLEQPVDSALQAKADLFLCPVYDVNKMMYFNGNDAVSLELASNNQTIDLFAFVGGDMTSDDSGWGSLNDTTITWTSGGVQTEYTIENYMTGPLFWLSWTENQTLIRKFNVGEGVHANPDPYFVVFEEWDSIPVNTFDSLGFHNCNCSTFGIDENIIQTNINIFPNPVVNGVFTIEAEASIEEVRITDVTGKLIEFTQLDGQNGSIKMNIPENLKGYYFVAIKLSSGQVTTKKLLLL